MSEKGPEIRAAIAYDLWKLKLISPALIVNFEHLRPCYQHWLPRLTDKTEDDFIEKAYNLFGGNSFDPDKEVTATTTSTSVAGPSDAPRRPNLPTRSRAALRHSSTCPPAVPTTPSP